MFPIIRGLISLCLIYITTCLGPQSKLCSSGEASRICIPSDYRKLEFPSKDEPTMVSIGVDILDIPKINDNDFTITLNAYFMVQWRDARLEITGMNGTETKLIPVNTEEFSEKLWIPDVG